MRTLRKGVLAMLFVASIQPLALAGFSDSGSSTTTTNNVAIGTTAPTSRLTVQEDGERDAAVTINALADSGPNNECDSYTKLLLHFDNSISTDDNCSSTNNSTITASGGADVSSTEPYFGNKSLELDGIDDYITVPNSSWMNLNGNDFSIKFRVYRNAGSYTVMSRFQAVPPYTGWNLTYGNSNALKFYTDNNTLRITCSSTQNTGTWAAYKLEGYNGNVTLYKDGTSCGTWAGSPQDYSTNLTIGTNMASSYLNGYLDEVKIDIGNARSPGNYTVELSPFSGTPTYYNAKTTYQIDSVDKFNVGVDGSDSNKFKISGGSLTGNPFITVAGDGNVGINSTNPGAKLDVNGQARFVSIGTTTPGTLACFKADGTLGYCTGSVTNSICGTCN